MTKSTWTPRVKLWFELEGRYTFGYGIAHILELVDEHGSIRAAADALGKSYRYVWGRIKELEKRLGKSLVESTLGGAGPRRSRLTPAGRRFTKAFLELRSELQETARKRCRSFPR